METTAVVILALIVVLVAGCWMILFQLVRQQGRILLRLDEIESRIADVATRAAETSANGQQIATPQPAAQAAPPEPRGIQAGAIVPDFRLRDVKGRVHSLESYRGKRVLLVHWSTQCGFCDMIAQELSGLQSAFTEHNVQMLLVSYGESEANIRMAGEYGFDVPILLQAHGTTIDAFESLGTPVAYLIDEDGRVLEPLAIGADQVPDLARRAASGASDPNSDAADIASSSPSPSTIASASHDAHDTLPGARPLSESRIPRDGLSAGTPAPTFTLPDVYGKTVSLESYRGRRVLLVFSDPNCGPCDELAPHLARLDREHRTNNLAVVMVGRGDVEENRKKAEELGLEFPVVMQEKWKLSKEYGIFATPVGYLIDENGVIKNDVAMGGGAILSLVSEH